MEFLRNLFQRNSIKSFVKLKYNPPSHPYSVHELREWIMTLPPEVIRSIPKSIVRPNLSYLLAIDMESAIWYYGKENAYNLIMKHLYKYEK